MRSCDRVMQRIVSQRDVDEVLARGGHRLGNRDRNLTRLAEAIAHAAGPIAHHGERGEAELPAALDDLRGTIEDRKSTRLNSSHLVISYAVFCLKKKNIL